MTFSIFKFLVATMGVVVGVIFGAIPGLSATMAVAIFLPLTYAYDLTTSLYLLLGLYVGGISGGLVSAILINVPGTSSAICTTFDGHPMALRGEGERAIKIGVVSSFFGGMVSLVFLWFFTPMLSSFAINFGAVEKFLLILFAMTVIAALSKGSLLKGIFAGFLGVLLALVGSFSDNQMMRMVPATRFFKVNLRSGFQLMPVLVGIFAVARMLIAAEKGMKNVSVDKDNLKEKNKQFSFKDFNGQWINVIRSAIIGTFVGALPGIGGSAASILSYSQAKNFSKHPDDFGTGIVDGVVASESANNGITGGALIPLLSLGIPGDTTTAVLIGAFMLQGIQVGPLFIKNNPDIWNTILFSLFICNIIMFFFMFFAIKYLAQIIKLPKSRIYAITLMMCTVGAWVGRNGNILDVSCLIVFGILGFLMSKFGFPFAPFFIGFILGDDLEQYFVDSIKGSAGSLSVFFSRPIGNVIWVLIILSIAYSAYSIIKKKPKFE